MDVNQSQNKLTSYIQDLTKNLLYESSSTSNGKLVIVNNPNKKNEPQAFLSAKVIYFPNKYQVTYILKDKDGNEFFSKMPDITRTDELKSQEENSKIEKAVSLKTDSTIVKPSAIVSTKSTAQTNNATNINTQVSTTIKYNPNDPCAKNNTGTVCLINTGDHPIKFDVQGVYNDGGFHYPDFAQIDIESHEQGCFYNLSVGSHKGSFRCTDEAYAKVGIKAKDINVSKCATEENTNPIKLTYTVGTKDVWVP